MLNISEDIRSLTEFKRNTAELLEQLKTTGRPLVLTVNGKAEIVVQDARVYQELVDRLEAIEGIKRGLEQARGGKVKPAREALERIQKKHRVPKR